MVRKVWALSVLVLLVACGGGGGPGVTSQSDLAFQPDSASQPDSGGSGQDSGQGPDVADQGQQGEDGTVAPPVCFSDAECDDQDPCTKDTCTQEGCRHEPLLNGPCDDGDPCTDGDSCQNGVCVGGEFVCECKGDQDCGPGSDECHAKRCDLTTHTCVEVAVDNGTPCDDHDPCTEGEACWDAVCKGGKSVCECQEDKDCPPAQDPCKPLYCDVSTHQCKAEPVADGTVCDDHDPCTLGDVCQGGMCKSGAPKNCDDNDTCTDDTCNKTTGDCENIFKPQWGCCQQDSECDDRDPCTLESCVKHRCKFQGEPAGVTGFGCASVKGCEVRFCSEEDATCRILNLEMPAPLFDWDLTSGTMPKGMRWTSEGGGLGQDGAGASGGEGMASFAFPGHFVAAGVHVLYLALASGSDCSQVSKVQVKWDGSAVGATDCNVEWERAVLAFQRYGEAAGPLDLEVVVQSPARVTRATLYLWAVRECKPLGPAMVVAGSGAQDLSVAGTRGVVGVGHRFSVDTIRFGTYSLGSGVKDVKSLASQTMMNSAYHRTALIPLPGDRFLFAYDGQPGGSGLNRIEVAVLDQKGNPLMRDFVPQSNDQASHYEPYLMATGPEEGFLGYAATQADGSGLGVALRTIQVLPGGLVFGEAKTVNTGDITGDQYRPVLAWSGNEGVAAWATWNPAGWPSAKVSVRKFTKAGGQGIEYKVAESSIRYKSLALVASGDYYFLAAATEEGDLMGYRIRKDLSQVTAWSDLPVGGFWSDVALVPRSTGAVLVATYEDVDGTRVVLVPIGVMASAGPLVNLTGQVISLAASPTLGAFSPFVQVLAYQDVVSTQKGTRVMLWSSKCDQGSVLCASNESSVCTGLGGGGYVKVPLANAWCK